MPVAKARSCGGNHSATALLHAGKFTASVSPNIARHTPNCAAPVTEACIAEATDHSAAPAASPFFSP
jgi:hypothetical protein